MNMDNIKVSVTDLFFEDRKIWDEIISSDFSDDNILKNIDYLKNLEKIKLVITNDSNTIKIKRHIIVSPERCVQCTDDRYTTNGTICHKHLIDIVKTNKNIFLTWRPGSFMSGGYADYLCGCSEDLSCCFGIGGYSYQCQIHRNYTYKDALLNN